MTAVNKWVAAGSSAAVLAGGLFLGAPAAHADTCAAPSASVSNLVAAAGTLYATGEHFDSLVEDPAVLGQLQAQQAVLEDAIVNDATMDDARSAWNEILRLQESYAASTSEPAVDEAYAAAQAAATNFEAAATEARLQGDAYMEDGAELMALFQGNCEAGGAGTGTHTGSGVNQGINMQTAGEGGLSTGVLAGLLAAGAAVSGAVAFRVRRRNA